MTSATGGEVEQAEVVRLAGLSWRAAHMHKLAEGHQRPLQGVTGAQNGAPAVKQAIDRSQRLPVLGLPEWQRR